MFVCSESGPTIGWILCPPLFVWKDRTTVSWSASKDSLVRLSPNWTPGSRVGMTPVMVRTAVGAATLGSKVSNWLGPPCWNKKTTDFPVTAWGARCRAPRAARSAGSDRLPSPRPPAVRSRRRGNFPLRSKIESMVPPVACRYSAA